MSYFERSISLYPNYLFHNAQDRESSLNFDPENEPSITGETYSTSGGETSGPAYDLVDGRRGAVTTIDTSGQTTSPQIDFDLTQSASSLDTVIIDNHNLKTATAWVTLKYGGGPTTVTVNNAYNSTQTYIGERGGLELTSATVNSNQIRLGSNQDGMMLAECDSFSSNNLIIDIDYDTTPAAYGDDITLGEVCFSRKWTAPHAPEIQPWEDETFQNTQFYPSSGGIKHASGTHGERKRWRITWNNLTYTQKQNLEQVYLVTKHGRYPMYFDLGEGSNPYLYFGRFAEDGFKTKALTGVTWTATIILETEF